MNYSFKLSHPNTKENDIFKHIIWNIILIVMILCDYHYLFEVALSQIHKGALIQIHKVYLNCLL